MEAAVDFAVDWSCWPACWTLVVASLTELAFGMFLTADEKLFQALSSEPMLAL
jgi:hypothetical protein